MATVEKDTISIEKVFAFAPQKLWEAWTEPDIIKQWFGSDPNGTVSYAVLDVWLGGHFEISFNNADGEEHTCFGTYYDVELYKLLRFCWEWKSEPGVESFVTVVFIPQDNGTLMQFTHANVGHASAHNYLKGWHDTFWKLERALNNV